MNLNCKYPIIAMPMIGGSDSNLAIASAEAGILPSLNSINYINNNFLIEFEEELKLCYNNGNILINFLASHFYKNFTSIMKILLKYKVKYILIQYGDSKIDNDLFFKILITLKKIGIQIFVSEHYHIEYLIPGILNYVDGIFVKGPDVAGIYREYDVDLETSIKKFRKKYDIPVIGVGGIGNKEDMINVLDAGASAIGIGTLLAMSLESPLSLETKMKMIKAKKEDLTFIDVYKKEDPNYDGKQRVLYFSDYENKTNDIRNRNGLMLGIQNKGGHVYAGKGIDKLNELLSVKEIVNRLVSI